jgi:hypothetical protein
MKISVNIFVYFIAISIAFLSCSDSSDEQNISSSSSEQDGLSSSSDDSYSSSSDTSSSSSSVNAFSSSSLDYQLLTEKLIMDSRVVSYQRTTKGYDYMVSLSSDYFTSDENVLKAWFPHIFNEKQTESECNYFARYWIVSSFPPTLYYTLTEDMVLHVTKCTYEKPFPMTDDKQFETMLICDDKAGTIRNSMEQGSIPWKGHIDPVWICGSSGTYIEDIYF